MPKKVNRRHIIVLLSLLILGIGLHLGLGNLHGAVVNAEMKLTWTAPGDDGMLGQASQYSLRYAETSDSLVSNWNNTTEIAGVPVPGIAGQTDSVLFTLPLETGKDYFFGIKTADEVPNWSILSNVVLVNVPDGISPNPVTDLQYEVLGVN